MAGQNDPWMAGGSDNVTLSTTPNRTITIASQSTSCWLLKLVPGIFALWTLRTPAAASDVDTLGALNGLSDLVYPGSWIFLRASTGGSAENGLMLVRTVTAGVVDAANLNALGLSNSD